MIAVTDLEIRIGARVLMSQVNFRVARGDKIGLVGRNGAGKTTLTKILAGDGQPDVGTVERIGEIGYLPQDVELLDGTIAENIARFGDVDAEAVVKAAKHAGVHEMILALPEGYETRLEGNFTLSAGQRQRVALARALYGDPAVVILDEPNSNLDEAGNAALQKALDALRELGSTVVIVTHRSGILEKVDAVLLLVDGKLALHGSPAQVASALHQRQTSSAGASPVNKAVA